VATLLRAIPLLLLAACYDPVDVAKDAPVVAESRRFRAQMEIARLKTESEQFHALKGEWPDSWQDLKRSGIDPWGEEYILEPEGNEAIIFSSGPDREIATDDDVFGG
jgi:hypothetical protein